MITYKDFSLILDAILQNNSLFDSLRHYKIKPLIFFKHINDNPELKHEFELARQIATEQILDASIKYIDKANTDLDLKKATLKVRTQQWMAEKLIPETYGSRVDINVNHTVDIKGVLDEANKRVFVPSDVLSSNRIEDERDEYVNILGSDDQMLDEQIPNANILGRGVGTGGGGRF